MIEFSVSLFFAKLVAYTFLFWLPFYVAFHRKIQLQFDELYIIIFVAIGGRYIGEQKADLLATLYDVGGILGKKQKLPFDFALILLVMNRRYNYRCSLWYHQCKSYIMCHNDVLCCTNCKIILKKLIIIIMIITVVVCLPFFWWCISWGFHWFVSDK